MEGNFEVDSSFFKITSPFGLEKNITQDTISFEFHEEVGKMPEGSIVLSDQTNFYSRVFVPFTPFDLIFGYHKRNPNSTQLNTLTANPTEIIGGIQRLGIKGFLMNPSGSGSSDGKIIFNCNFMGQLYANNKKDVRVFAKGTRALPVYQNMGELGCSKVYVNFSRMSEQLTSTQDVRQYETGFRFLLRLASEWRCFFCITHDSTGQLVGLFVDQEKIGSKDVASFLSNSTGAIGDNRTLEFGIGSINANVISYSWQNHAGDNAQGDNVNIQYINGVPITTRYVATTEKVTAYRLNEQRIQDYLVKFHGNEGELLQQIISAQNLYSVIDEKTNVKYFFDEVQSETAPQGMGYTCNVEILGDPLLVPGMQIRFGNGFPDVLRNVKNEIIMKYYIKKISHKMDSSGYKCSLEIGDAISVYGSFVH